MLFPERMPHGRATAILVVAAALLGAWSFAARATPAGTSRAIEMAIQPDEQWWAGVVSESHRMPIGRSSPPFGIDLFGNTAGNQVQPLLVSTDGRYIWSVQPFTLAIREGTIRTTSDLGLLETGRAGTTLREVAPVVEKNARRRRLVIPPGRWRGDDGGVVEGPKAIEIDAPLERLPASRRIG